MKKLTKREIWRMIRALERIDRVNEEIKDVTSDWDGSKRHNIQKTITKETKFIRSFLDG